MRIIVAIAAAFVLLARSAQADPIGVVVDNTGDGIVVTVNTEAANIHFTYAEQCDGGKPCYQIEAGQGMVGISASARACKVNPGNGYTPTGIECPVGAGSITFKLTNGGTWSAYEGGGGQHTGPCSPARVIVTTGKGANSINTWNGCHEVVQCNTAAGALAMVEADANDDVTGKCTSVIKH